MCGIAGALAPAGRALAPGRFRAMVDAIAHRGPDDAGYYVWRRGEPGGLSFGEDAFRAIRPDLAPLDAPESAAALAAEPASVFLGHRRLSIIDLSAAGHQPMTDASGQVSLSYNGEVYNFRELRKELEGRGARFRGHSDTEVLLEAYLAWGIECVHRLNGMFAFALWDAREGRLFLARDRYGIKPLYWAEREGALLFASEVKSILAYGGGRTGVDVCALDEYFSFQNVLSSRTLFEGVELLPAAHVLSVDLETGRREAARYWDFDLRRESHESPDELRERLVDALTRAVVRQCVSDVPVSCYLSGGMDSGTITAIASRELGRIRTFTVGFDLSGADEHERGFDERALARRMAEAFHTEHCERVLRPDDVEAAMERLTWHLEDPRVGQSYPNFYAAELAGRFGKVVLTGTGGDELFGGYPWRYAAASSPDGRDFVERYYRYWQRLVSDADKPRLFQPEVQERMRRLGSEPRRVFERALGASGQASVPDPVRRALRFECKTFLHGLLLVEDKLSMAHSLEARVPLLDNELVDLACRIPVEQKVADLAADGSGRGKLILREAMARILPERIARAPKQGFSAPDASWFRDGAARYVREMLLDPGSRIHEYLSPVFVENVLEEHSRGRSNRRLLIWSLLSFETWLRRFQ